jgi:chromosome segregation ATPase
MKRLVLVLALLMACPVWAQEKPAAKPEAPPALTEVQQLQAKLYKADLQVFELQKAVSELRATLADREARLASAYLTGQQADLEARRKALETEYLKALKAPEGSAFDWDKITFTAPAKGKE